MNHQLTTAEEAAFMKMLENILETAYNMQEEAEHMFIYQESVLNKSKRKALSVNFVGISEIDGNGSTSSLSRHPLLSVSSVDQVYIHFRFKKLNIFFVKQQVRQDILSNWSFKLTCSYCRFRFKKSCFYFVKLHLRPKSFSVKLKRAVFPVKRQMIAF